MRGWILAWLLVGGLFMAVRWATVGDVVGGLINFLLFGGVAAAATYGIRRWRTNLASSRREVPVAARPLQAVPTNTARPAMDHVDGPALSSTAPERYRPMRNPPASLTNGVRAFTRNPAAVIGGAVLLAFVATIVSMWPIIEATTVFTPVACADWDRITDGAPPVSDCRQRLDGSYLHPWGMWYVDEIRINGPTTEDGIFFGAAFLGIYGLVVVLILSSRALQSA